MSWGRFFYQKQCFNFNGWMKCTQKWTRFTWYDLSDSQSIDDEKCNHKNGTLTMIFLNPIGEENLCVQFGYIPQKICYHNQGQVSGSINSDSINSKTLVGNKQRKSSYVILKNILDQSNQPIDINRYKHPTTTLVITFLNN